jgi:DNA-binding response OmpR family regulator
MELELNIGAVGEPLVYLSCCGLRIAGKIRTVDKLARLTILVVDDEAIIGMLIEDILADAGCNSVELKSNLRDAETYLAANRPDFAILDINLGGTQSYPLADHLRAAGVPFLFLSGYGARGLDPAYAECRALPKPFQHDDLLVAVHEALAEAA